MKKNIDSVAANRWIVLNENKPNRKSRRELWCHRQRGDLTNRQVQAHNGTVSKPASLSRLTRRLFQQIAKIANKKK